MKLELCDYCNATLIIERYPWGPVEKYQEEFCCYLQQMECLHGRRNVYSYLGTLTHRDKHVEHDKARYQQWLATAAKEAL